MPTGDLHVHISDVRGKPGTETVDIDFKPLTGDPGFGGEGAEVSLKMGPATEITITKLSCRESGMATTYRVLATAKHYRAYSFNQPIREGMVNPAVDDIEFFVKPGDVKEIRAPKFSDLPDKVREILAGAHMLEGRPDDQDVAKDRELLGLSGAELYSRLSPLRTACLLNIATKAAHPSSDNCLHEVRELLICRQDRFFAFVDEGLSERLQASEFYKAAPADLHKPLAGFRMTKQSFKTRDPHANLQVTFMQHIASGRFAADVDIDESAGVEHGFEVIRNAVFKNRTNPFLIREFMLASRQDPPLDPGYDFVF